MSCGCSGEMWADDYEESAVWREFKVGRSRSTHHCCECGDEIPAGSRVCAAASLYDGRWSTLRRCLCCAALVEMIATTQDVCVNLWGGLQDACDDLDVDWTEWRDKFYPERKRTATRPEPGDGKEVREEE